MSFILSFVTALDVGLLSPLLKYLDHQKCLNYFRLNFKFFERRKKKFLFFRWRTSEPSCWSTITADNESISTFFFPKKFDLFWKPFLSRLTFATRRCATSKPHIDKMRFQFVLISIKENFSQSIEKNFFRLITFIRCCLKLNRKFVT